MIDTGRIRRGAQILRNLFLVPRCIGCDERMPATAVPDVIFCPFCRTAWEGERQRVSLRGKGRGLHIYLALYRPGNSNGVVERLIYHIKHKGSPAAFEFLAGQLVPGVTASIREIGRVEPGVHVIVSYPPRRRTAVNQDGFDQAARLSRALAKALGGEHRSLFTRKARDSGEQKKMGAVERAGNATSAYALRHTAAEDMAGRVVVLCDDVCTTGATLLRCATLLYEAGAAAVILCTVTKSERQEPSSGQGD